MDFMPETSHVVSIIEYPLGEGVEHVQDVFVRMGEVFNKLAARIGDPLGAPKLKIPPLYSVLLWAILTFSICGSLLILDVDG